MRTGPVLDGKRILLIVAGGIAAYKTLELTRRLVERGASARCVLTEAGAEFVTPLSLSALSGDRVYRDLFSLTDEHEMGHIRLSRSKPAPPARRTSSYSRRRRRISSPGWRADSRTISRPRFFSRPTRTSSPRPL